MGDNQQEALAYDEFGVPMVETGANLHNLFGFVGYQPDEVTESCFAQARYYEPVTSRIVSPDLWAGDLYNPASLNKYMYCYNNPLKYVDLDGLEPIVVAGGAFDPESEDEYQYTFVDTSLLQASTNNEPTTLLVANAGWQPSQYDAITQYAEVQGLNLVWFDSTEQLTNYINTGSIDGKGNIRASDPITSLHVFSHGTDRNTGDYAVTFGLNTSSTIDWSIADIQRINSSAFADYSITFFYSCRTGNYFRGGNFAQEFANQTNSSTYAFVGLNGRTDYSHILGNPFERRGIGFWLGSFNAWKAARGEVTDSPGAAFRLPQGSFWFSRGEWFYSRCE